jgi:glycerol-3-phosphate acyltransferase PlsY
LIKGIDVREHGSKNPGATNAIRVLGKPIGLTVFVLDVLKGGLVILLIRLGVFGDESLLLPVILYGLAAVIGHIFPIFLRFKGGKAVATGAGVFLFYAPLLGLLGGTVFVLTIKKTGYVSMASTLGALSVLAMVLGVYLVGPENSNWSFWIGGRWDHYLLFVTVLSISFIIYRHRGNYARIQAGTEPKTKWLYKDKASSI